MGREQTSSSAFCRRANTNAFLLEPAHSFTGACEKAGCHRQGSESESSGTAVSSTKYTETQPDILDQIRNTPKHKPPFWLKLGIH